MCLNHICSCEYPVHRIYPMGSKTNESLRGLNNLLLLVTKWSNRLRHFPTPSLSNILIPHVHDFYYLVCPLWCEEVLPDSNLKQKKKRFSACWGAAPVCQFHRSHGQTLEVVLTLSQSNKIKKMSKTLKGEFTIFYQWPWRFFSTIYSYYYITPSNDMKRARQTGDYIIICL